MSKSQEIIGVRSFVMITGASRGFGRALALEMGKVVGAGSTLLLVARSKEDLEITKEIVRDARPGLAVEVETVDLSSANKETFERVVRANYGSADHEVAIIIHNAGTLGQDGRKLTELTDVDEMSDYYRLNLFHVICLNSVFMAMFPKSRLAFVNVSSILALKPLTTWGHYCGCKAARDAVFRVLAVEQPQALVLNYAPGPLDTPMITELLADQRTDQVVRTMFEDLKRNGALLKPGDSASKLVALLRKRNFKSGDHVDYYDEKVKEACNPSSTTQA
jgi:sepiapterin reductase